MLNIPDSIKSLYKTDGVHKNFRVHFPGGQYPDVTNENVVRESLRFTESVCSRQFKFGLAEASVIEFETVGVGNMYGLTIECSIEVDTTSLSAADITAIEADPGDGTLVLEEDSDLGFGFYRIPLGTFKVTSCPRNHGAMTHRRVVAMSLYTGGSFPDSPYQYAKLAMANRAQSLRQNISLLVWAGVGYRFPAVLDGLSITRSYAFQGTRTVQFNKTVGGVTIRGTHNDAGQIDPGYSNRLNMYDLAQYDTSAAVEWARAQFAGVPAYAEYADAAAAAVAEVVSGYVVAQNVTYPVPVVDGKVVFYPDGWSYFPGVPQHVDINIDFPGGTVSGSFDLFDLAASVYVIFSAATFPSYMIRFQQTGVASDGVRYTFIDGYDFGKLLNGWFELYGQFGRQTRGGAFEVVALDDSSPVSVSPGDYEEIWWDEYDVSPVGTVLAPYNGGEVAEIIVGDGQSRYDMTDNAVFGLLENSDLTSVETMVNTHFVPNLPTVAFTPVEMTMQGWPWLEAGDALEITAEDGTVIKTYALRVEMSGIQHLTMSVESEGGSIVGEV